MSRRLALGFALLVAIGCAKGPSISKAPSGPWTAAPGIPVQAELTCATDGSTTLTTDTVQAQPDGVHLTVINRFDEPVSVEGFDANPGVTHWKLANGPSTMHLMCWPYSQHSSGAEPPRISLEIVDPEGLYLDGSVACQFHGMTIADYFQGPIDRGPPPMKVAHELITGLRPDDVLRVAGYPEMDGGAVVVIRDDEVVASYGIVRFKDEPWSIAGMQVCDGTGLRFEGQNVN